MRRNVLMLTLMAAVAAFPLWAQQARGGQPQQQHPQPQQAHPQAQARGNQPSHAQPPRQSAPGVGGGHIPKAPPPQARNAKPAPRTGRADVAGHPTGPHVDAKGDVWVGRAAPNDARYHLDRPWQHGHFPGTVGSSQIWRLEGGGPSRFWFNGYAFMVAQPDLGYCNNWLWGSDDIVLYQDPDQPGWYIAYNPRLGTWCHVEYLGPL